MQACRLQEAGGREASNREPGWCDYAHHRFGESRGRYYDVGTWNVADDGKYCRQWSKWRDGARDCFEMYDLGEGKYRFLSIDRRYDTRGQILEGDPHRLQATAR